MHVSFSQVKYKSDLNWLRGIGWTPPGSHKVEMARRAAELAYLREMGLLRAPAQYSPGAVSRVNHSSHKSQQLCSLPAHILSNTFECSLESTVLPITRTGYVHFLYEALCLSVHLNLREPLKGIQQCQQCHVRMCFPQLVDDVRSPSVLVPLRKAEAEVEGTPHATSILFS